MSWIATTLKKQGYRVTTPRKQVGRFIENQCGIFSAVDVIKELPGTDKVSVYRTLELFERMCLIHPVGQHAGTRVFEANVPDNHHHHAVCAACGKVSPMDCYLKKPRISGFTIKHHSLSVHGLCDGCIS